MASAGIWMRASASAAVEGCPVHDRPGLGRSPLHFAFLLLGSGGCGSEGNGHQIPSACRRRYDFQGGENMGASGRSGFSSITIGMSSIGMKPCRTNIFFTADEHGDLTLALLRLIRGLGFRRRPGSGGSITGLGLTASPSPVAAAGMAGWTGCGTSTDRRSSPAVAPLSTAGMPISATWSVGCHVHRNLGLGRLGLRYEKNRMREFATRSCATDHPRAEFWSWAQPRGNSVFKRMQPCEAG